MVVKTVSNLDLCLEQNITLSVTDCHYNGSLIATDDVDCYGCHGPMTWTVTAISRRFTIGHKRTLL